jgi:hypothetical protein
MGSPEVAIVKEMTRQGRRDCDLSLREERPLQYIGTGADAKETPAIEGQKRLQLKTGNTRNEGLETPVFKST